MAAKMQTIALDRIKILPIVGLAKERETLDTVSTDFVHRSDSLAPAIPE